MATIIAVLAVGIIIGTIFHKPIKNYFDLNKK